MTEHSEATPTAPRLLSSIFVKYRKLFFFVGLSWFALLVGGGITLSTLDARSGLHIFGSKVWKAGQSGILRVALKDLTVHRNHPLEWVEVRFVDNDGRPHSDQVLTETVGSFKQGRIEAPTRPGPWRVEIRAQGPNEVHTAEISIDVKTRVSPAFFPAPKKPPPPMQPDVGPLKLDIRPIDGQMAAGLPGHLALLAQDSAGPIATVVDLGLETGRSKPALPKRVGTAANGLAMIPIRPMHPVFTFHLSSGESRAIRQIKHVATQFTLETAQPVVQPGPTAFKVRSLHRNAQVFVDVWWNEYWMDSTGLKLVNGQGELKVTIPNPPEDAHGWIWIQVYKDPYLPQGARGGQLMVVTKGQVQEGFDWGLGKLVNWGYGQNLPMIAGAQKPAYGPKTARLLFGLVNHPERNPPLLMDSSITAKQTVAQLKGKWQTRFVGAFVGTGACLFLILGVLLWRNQTQVKKGWAEHGGTETGVAGNRGRFFLDVGYIFLVLAGFLFGIIQLLLSIHW